MRWIDANALSEKLCETTIFIKDGEVFQRMINDAPSADAVEVVRCKDCKHRHEAECPMYWEEQYDIDEGDGYYDTDYIFHDYTQDDGYCNWGERKGGDSE